jgi:hypothetical protein
VRLKKARVRHQAGGGGMAEIFEGLHAAGFHPTKDEAVYRC